jgi:thiamine-phosphate pyrophosphorylase
LIKRAEPIFCYVTDRLALAPGEEIAPLLSKIDAAVERGIRWIQIREKDLSGCALWKLAQQAVSLAARSQTRILVNGRLDVALAAGAAGVHLGEAELPVRAVCAYRAAFGPEFLVGRSCHSADAAEAAARAGADYIFFGPVFSTPSKERFGPAQGLGRLSEACRRVTIPVLAIGGVTLENAASCLAAGAAGVAAIRLFQQTNDVGSVLLRLLAGWQGRAQGSC